MATYNGSAITRDPPTGRAPGVYPVKVVGVINIASNTSFGSTAPDTLPLCAIPYGSILTDVKIGFPAALDAAGALGFKLVDTLASPTTYIAAITTSFTSTGGLLTLALIPGSTNGMAAAQVPNLGTMYGSTARSIGATGAPVVVWTAGVKLVLSCITSSTDTTGASALNINYIVEWSPAFDMGT